MRRTTRNSKRRSTPSSRNGAQRCCRSKDRHVVAYHDSWPYFAHRFGFNIDIFLEPKPGIPPSPSHLAEVIAQMKAQKIKAIIVEPFHDRKIAEKVASATGAKVVDFAQFPGRLPDTETYVQLMDALVSRIWPRGPQKSAPIMWEVMFWPIVACVLLPWLLVYLGLHVVQRGIIFIDIAMAQMASLGICLAVLFRLDLESPATFAIALGFTLARRGRLFAHRKTRQPRSRRKRSSASPMSSPRPRPSCC